VGSHLVTALQTIVSRNTDPFTPIVVSVTQFHAGSTFNVIPDTALLQGTVRSFNAELHEETYSAIKRICDGVAQACDVGIDLIRSKHCYPPTVNDPALTKQCVHILQTHGNVVHQDCPPSMGAEDFSYYCQEKPGCFVFLGNGDSYPLHHPKFNFNDAILTVGAQYWVDLAHSYKSTA
jgi:hippurate hydrolase